jgi:hypothetical protein
VVKQRTPDEVETRRSSHDDQHGEPDRRAELVHVHDVESGNGNTLEQDGAEVTCETPLPYQRGHPRRRVGAVPPNGPSYDPIQPSAGADGPNQADVASMLVVKRGVIEADDVGELPSHARREHNKRAQRAAQDGFGFGSIPIGEFWLVQRCASRTPFCAARRTSAQAAAARQTRCLSECFEMRPILLAKLAELGMVRSMQR